MRRARFDEGQARHGTAHRARATSLQARRLNSMSISLSSRCLRRHCACAFLSARSCMGKASIHATAEVQ
jgi:hypothetical protein